MNFLLALEIASQTSPGKPLLRRSALLTRTWAVITHSSAAGHLPAPSSSLLCRTRALLDLPAEQWEDFPGAVTQSHSNPGVFTESRSLKKGKHLSWLSKPELGARTHQPPPRAAQGLTGCPSMPCFEPPSQGSFCLGQISCRWGVGVFLMEKLSKGIKIKLCF